MRSKELHPWLGFDPGEAQRVITRFLSTYVERAGANGLVIGLSGGLDSALTAALATDALGPEHVDVFHLPGPTSGSEDLDVAYTMASHLGLELPSTPIGPATDALEAELTVEADRDVHANVQARMRMVALYAQAQATGQLVAGTGNKSELLVGYFTKHGDGGVDLLPIGDLYKTQVRLLARQLALPDRVIERPPSAGLWEGQTDEDELGVSYATLDVLLAGIERQASTSEIAETANVSEDEVERVRSMVRSTWHKRNPPPVPKLGWRTIGVDWREATQGAP